MVGRSQTKSKTVLRLATLYGTRGNMPAPQYLPPSIFRYPRGEHSAKPPEIRAEIEKM